MPWFVTRGCLAADRAVHSIDDIPPERFEQLWSAEREFVLTAREEPGLASDFEIGGRPLPGTERGDVFWPY